MVLEKLTGIMEEPAASSETVSEIVRSDEQKARILKRNVACGSGHLM